VNHEPYRENSDGGKWYEVERDGRVILESESYRENRAIEENVKLSRKNIRSELKMDLEDIDNNADLLMDSMESFYTFGDKTYSPNIIYLKAGELFGFEAKYVKSLVSNLCERKIVVFEYDPDPDLDIKDSLDCWHLIKNT